MIAIHIVLKTETRSTYSLDCKGSKSTSCETVRPSVQELQQVFLSQLLSAIDLFSRYYIVALNKCIRALPCIAQSSGTSLSLLCTIILSGHFPRTLPPELPHPINRPTYMSAKITVVRSISSYGPNYFHQSSFHLNNERVSSNLRVG